MLQTGHIHLWIADLRNIEIEFLFAFLSSVERERAARFRFGRDRQRYIARRGLLRVLLAKYTCIAPEQVRYVANAYGKLSIDRSALPAGADSTAADLHFNLSHSNGVALFAFALGQELGVDVEFVRRDFEFLPIAERFFSPSEQQTLRGLPVEQQAQAFFNCWTRKEAYIKAQGQGLSLPLDAFDVSLAPGEPARLMAIRHETDAPAETWSLFHLEPAPGFVGALAIRGQGWQMDILSQAADGLLHFFQDFA